MRLFPHCSPITTRCEHLTQIIGGGSVGCPLTCYSCVCSRCKLHTVIADTRNHRHRLRLPLINIKPAECCDCQGVCSCSQREYNSFYQRRLLTPPTPSSLGGVWCGSMVDESAVDPIAVEDPVCGWCFSYSIIVLCSTFILLY